MFIQVCKLVRRKIFLSGLLIVLVGFISGTSHAQQTAGTSASDLPVDTNTTVQERTQTPGSIPNRQEEQYGPWNGLSNQTIAIKIFTEYRKINNEYLEAIEKIDGLENLLLPERLAEDKNLEDSTQMLANF